MSKISISKILKLPWSGICLAALLLAGLATQARADTFGICDSEAASGGANVSNATYSTSASTGCVPGFNSSLATGGSVSPTSLGAGLTTASLTVDQLMPFGGTAISTSTASLDNGTLSLYADTQGGTGSCGGTCVGTGGRSTPEAIFDDTLHFTITDGAPSAIVTIHAHLDGTIASEGLNTFGYTLMDQFSLGGGSACWDSAGGVSGSGFGLCGSQNFGFSNPTFTNQTATGFDFTGTFSVTNGEASVLFAALQADCQNGAACDFSHTSTLSLSLPSDVTFTSASGVLFTQSQTAVPEPSSSVPLLAAMFAIGLAARRRAAARRLLAALASPRPQF